MSQSSLKANPAVFVVVPCYNYGRFLSKCVHSVLDQAGVAVQVLIIDDASSDQTSSIAKALAKDGRVDVFSHRRNCGHVRTFNEGIAVAQGDYFLLLSADDYLLPGALERATNLMERHPDVGFTFGRARIEGTSSGSLGTLPLASLGEGERILSGRQFVELSGPRNIVPSPTAVVRRQLQQHVGGYLEILLHSGDMEMWLRLAAQGSVGYIDAEQAVYRRHEDNMSIAYDGLEDLRAREKAFRAFIANGAHKLDPTGHLEKRCLYWLSSEAFRYASMALNRNDRQAALQFQQYGLALSPTARFSLGWLKLLAKRAIGQLPLNGHRTSPSHGPR